MQPFVFEKQHEMKRQLALLVEAAKQGLIDTVKDLLNDGADINGVSFNNESALIAATAEGHITTVSYLIQLNADVNANNWYGETPLMLAAENGNDDILLLLLQAETIQLNLQINGLDQINAALFYATKIGKLTTFSTLLHFGANINAVDSFGDTLIMAAIHANANVNLIAFLVESRAAIFTKNQVGLTALLIAAERGNKNIVSFLIDRGAGAHISLCDAARCGWAAKVCEMIEQGCDVNSKSERDGCTPLINAVKWQDIHLVLNIIKCGANIELRDNGDCTPLMHAIKCYNINLVRLLLAYGATFGAFEDGSLPSKTALTFAIETHQMTIVLELLYCGADVNGTSGDHGNSVLIDAVKANDEDIVQALLALNASVNLANSYGFTPLQISAANGRTKLISLLLSEGLDFSINCMLSHGLSAIQFAMKGQYYSSALYLLNLVDKYGIDMDSPWLLAYFRQLLDMLYCQV